MQVSVDWLRDYANLKRPVEQVADRLTMTLNEVEAVTGATGLDEVVVAEVIALEPHPNADRLQVATVRTGRNRTHRVVTGAPNAAVGEKIPFAAPGTTLPNGLKVTKRTFRGVASAGMLCSPQELGAGDDHDGLWLLPADSETGQSVAQALRGRLDGFELDVAANRPDLLGHLGIAREAAAAFGVPLREPVSSVRKNARPGAYQVKSQDPADTPRLALARIRGIKNGQSPQWLRDRLVSVGLRPISAVVDVTNFVMLEYGQPLHAYDAAKLTGVVIYSRKSRPDESVKTLDGKLRKLPKDILVIADRSRAIGIAGIMGGAGTEVSARTNDVVIEAANFAPDRIRRSARALGIRTDASARFEKGLPADLAWPAIRRAVSLLLEIGGGELVQLSDAYPKKARRASVRADLDRLAGFLGTGVPPGRAKAILTRLGFTVSGRGRTLSVTPPYWRRDIRTEADVFEELARLVGFDRVPSTLPVAPVMVPKEPQLRSLSRELATTAVGLGLTEVVTHSLIGDELLQRAGHPATELVRMENPLSEDHAFLRRSMEPRHLEAVAENLRWRPEVRLFEIGTTFKQVSKKVLERKRLLVTLAGNRTAGYFNDVRGILTTLIGSLGSDANGLAFKSLDTGVYVPGRAFDIVRDGVVLGHIAEYANPRRWKAAAVAFLSLELDRLVEVVSKGTTVAAPPAFPAVRRDLSLFVPQDVSYGEVRDEVARIAGPALREATQPAEYRVDGKRSLTVRLAFGASDRTLTDPEVTALMTKIEETAQKRGWSVRK